MRFRLVARGLAFDPETRAWVRGQALDAFGGLACHVSWVSIQVEDLNGPKGGVDKRCVVSLGGDRVAPLVLDVRDVNTTLAITRALRLARLSLLRCIQRSRSNGPPDRAGEPSLVSPAAGGAA